ncbi:MULTISPECIES: D-alanyl-D-alanine carboxypeptidase/D-alanyl-D-alanine endopeptidase [unclassified Luteococcus]|uniref:D-alanyl-D-alanine carboxypeptidase/D-alanyl-D-alanine endopeptidase n=1 Tax=unclassified Luteococcus TaxID=2639923 RepID=UPI00313C3303
MSPQQGQQGPVKGHGVLGWVATAVVVALLAVAGAVWWRPALYASGLWVNGGSPTVSPTFFDDPSQNPSPEPGQAVERGAGVAPSAAPASAGKDIDKQALAKALSAIPTAAMGTTSGVILDARTGAELWTSRPQTGQIPASTLKLLTCLAALNALGPDKTFTTTVQQASPGKIILVGGGDPLLASKPARAYPFPATTQDLAKQTAAALKKQGVSKISLGYDDSLFTGPNWHPSWPQGYHDQVTTISSLWIDKGKPDEKSAPSLTPAQTAGTVFAAQLKAAGITVVGTPVKESASAHARQLAAVQSLPVSTLVQETLVHSDNAAAEVLLRHIGLAGGKGGGFTGGAQAVLGQLAALKINTAGAKITDGSGLSRGNVLPAVTLAQALRAAAVTPKLRPVLEGLPVAGVNGTLHTRFYNPEAAAGRGWVNAKTGTLSKVSTLAGYTRTRNGREVVFAFMANNPTQEWEVRNWLDRMAATLTGCTC